MRLSTRHEVLTVSAVSVLSIMFLLRVLGQVIQRWTPVEFLPPFEAWQGSGLPYPMLLTSQVVILGLLAAAIRGMVRRRQVLTSKSSRVALVVGSAYFTVMAVRLILGLTLFADIRWFTAWISTALHLDLAAIVILWAWDQLRLARTMDE